MSTWDKKIHVESSLPAKDGQYAMFVGRWQPLHKGHQSLFQQVMDEGKNVLIININLRVLIYLVLPHFLPLPFVLH